MPDCECYALARVGAAENWVLVRNWAMMIEQDATRLVLVRKGLLSNDEV